MDATKTTAADLTASINKSLEQLAAATDAAKTSEQYLNYLAASAKFHNYSIGNVWLILMQNPNATMVAGFHDWMDKHHRFVKKGEHGIRILAPCFPKQSEQTTRETDRQPVYFRIVTVFDVSQTDGEPLPETPNWKSPERNEVLATKLLTFAASRSIAVTVNELAGDTQGMSTGGAIVLDPTAGTKTLIHEIAHELMKHLGSGLDHATRETEAEAVAYVVGVHFGLDNLASPNYIALSGADSKTIKARLTEIQKTANEIITAIESN